MEVNMLSRRGFLAGTAAMAATLVGRPRFLAAAVLGSVERNTSGTIIIFENADMGN